MLTIYKTTEQGVEQLESIANGTWVKAIDPTPEEVQQLIAWGIDADYVSGRITTMFLNSRAVDDIASSVVHDGAVVALSGAMPGLVGATMRRGGFYAAMRGAMTYREDGGAGGSDLAWVRVKLFNLLIRELGPGFLARGTIMSATELSAFLVAGEYSAGDFIAPLTLDNRPLAYGELAATLAALGEEELLLTVDFEDTP